MNIQKILPSPAGLNLSVRQVISNLSPFAFGYDILITLGAVVTAPNKMIILKFSSTLRSFLQFALLVFLLLAFLCFFE